MQSVFILYFHYQAVLKITLVPRFLFYSSLETNRKGPWGLGCIEIDIAIFEYWIHDDDDYSISKILETYNKLNKARESCVTMAWVTNTNYCLDGSQ